MRNPAALAVLSGDGDPLSANALSPDGGTLAIGDLNGTVVLFDTETRQRIGDYQSPRGTITALDFHPRDGSLLIVGRAESGRNAYLSIIDASTQRLRASASFGHHPHNPRIGYFPFATFAPDGRTVIVGYEAPLYLRRFDARTGSPLGRAVFVAPGSGLSRLGTAADGQLIYGGEEATYAIDPDTLRVSRRYPVGGAYTTGISADGATLAIGGQDGRVRLLDLDSGQMRSLTGRHRAAVLTEAFSADRRTLATSAEDGSAIVWDLRTGRPIETLEGHRDAVWGLSLSPDGRTLYTSSDDSTAMVWDVAGDRRLGHPFTTNFVNKNYYALPPPFAISPDARRLAVARLDGRVDFIDAQTLRRSGGFEAFPGTPLLAVEYSADGRRLAVASDRGAVGLWEAASGHPVGRLLREPRGGPVDNPHAIQALAFGPDGLFAAAEIGEPAEAGQPATPGSVRTWDLGRGEPELLERVPLMPFVLGLDFSPHRSELAITFGTSNEEGPNGIEVREVSTGERLARLRTDNEVRSVTYSADGGELVGGQIDGTALTWATDDWQLVGEPLAGDQGPLLSVARSPDGQTLATASDGGSVVLWDLASREQIGPPLPSPANRWTTARFTPDGRHLFAVFDNGRAMRWEVDPERWLQHACAVAGGGLTPEQWDQVVPEQDYVSICPTGRRRRRGLGQQQLVLGSWRAPGRPRARSRARSSPRRRRRSPPARG